MNMYTIYLALFGISKHTIMVISTSATTVVQHSPLSFSIMPLLLVFMLIQHNAMHILCSNYFTFITQPRDATVHEGESVSFECTLLSSVPVSSASSYWTNSKTENVQEKPFAKITKSTDEERRRITSRLLFQNVTREMDALYRCSLLIHGLSVQILSSTYARLNVLYFLREDGLTCDGQTSFDLEEGEQLNIQCEASQSNPPAALRWMWSNSTSLDPQFATPEEHEASSTLIANITITRLLHQEIIFCLATSTEFPGRRANCSLGPFNVIHPPAVEVVPDQIEISWPMAVSMTFQCLGAGYPPVEGYHWSCSPEEAFIQCGSHSKDLTVFVNPTEDGKVLNRPITCEAWNAAGTSRHQSSITVRHVSKNELPVCESNDQQYVDNKRDIWTSLTYGMYDEDSQHFFLKCSTKVRSTENITFRWTLNGAVISEKKGRYVLREEETEGTYIIAYSFLENLMGPGIVTCDHRSRRTQEAQQNLVACYSFSDMLSSSTEALVSHEEAENLTNETSYLHASTPSNITTLNYIDDASKAFWKMFWKVALAIAVVLGLLLCAMMVALGWRKLLERERNEVQTTTSAVQLTGVDDLKSTEPRQASSRVSDCPFYEIPNERLDLALSSLNDSQSSEEIHRHFRGNVDSVLEADGSSSDCTKSCYSSSSSDQRVSYAYEDEPQNESEDLQHYENCEVAATMIGKPGSKYLFEKLMENE